MILLFNKPFDVLTQFTDRNSETKRQTLSDFIDMPGYYAAGRLDKDSEGLLILTNNGKLQHKLSHPKYNKEKGYWVQLDGEISDEAILQLQQGVSLKDGLTKPAKARKIIQPKIWDRSPPIRVRQNIPTSWIELFISEGKNRQVRRMTAAVGFPTLRLIRFKIDQWQLKKLQPGEFIKIDHI
ncbi:MAG: pseudouridine synthase [Gammaproteobacteria bacterium]|nr:pseudouridine synthase [Gammaproteobacteria bacterium]